MLHKYSFDIDLNEVSVSVDVFETVGIQDTTYFTMIVRLEQGRVLETKKSHLFKDARLMLTSLNTQLTALRKYYE